MKRVALLLFAVAVVAGVVAALAQISTGTDVKPGLQSARDIRGASSYLEIEKEPAPKPIVDAPLPEGWPIPRASFGPGTEWRTSAFYPCSGRVPSRHLHVSGICTSPSTTCPGGGQMRATTNRRYRRAAARPAQGEDRAG